MNSVKLLSIAFSKNTSRGLLLIFGDDIKPKYLIHFYEVKFGSNLLSFETYTTMYET